MLTDIIIYTKDRACQLDLLLRSIKDNFLNVGKVWLLEDWSNDEYKAGYDKIKKLDYGLDIVYKRQNRSIFYDVLKQVSKDSITKFILPLCDDDVFIRRTDINDITSYVNNDVIGINLRFSSNLTVSYGKWGVLEMPKLLPAGEYLKWDWTTYKIHSRWGYPYLAGGLIYKTNFLRDMISEITFDLPNSFEGAMMSNRYKWKKNFIVGFKHSSIVNISVNRIQNDVPNRAGRDISYPQSELNSIFLSGNIIDTVGIYDMHNNCEFVEITLKFKEDVR